MNGSFEYLPPWDPDRGRPVRWLNMTVHVQKHNKRPVGYAPWSDLEEDIPAVPKKKKKKRKR